MSSPRLISVLIPCYNQARFLPQAIESVLSQQNANWELLISDDASTDDSAGIIRSFAARDPRIRFHLHSPNLGMAANWNWCLGQARGHYVKFLFGDDFHCAPDALASLAAALDAYSDAALATSARLIVDEQSRPQHTARASTFPAYQSGHDAIIRCLLENKNLIGEPSAVLFRRADAQRGFDATYRQLIDLEFYAHLLERGGLAYIDRPLCAFRRHASQQTAVNSRTRRGEDEGLRLQLKYLSLLERHVASGGSAHEVRQALFRGIYFARKTASRDPQSRMNEATLMRHLTPAWYAAYWLRHRLTKPLSNLGKALRKTRAPSS
jgi:glycosyltransferase involved in cell wall biosynthesis